eukprot:1156239-Pelagomonas_calceolata.AAC.3
MVPGLRSPAQLVTSFRATPPAGAQRPGDGTRPHPHQQQHQLQQNQPQTLVVFVTDNRVSQIAVDIATALAMYGCWLDMVAWTERKEAPLSPSSPLLERC